jgi:dTDP-glucose 4,6-dehydratase
MRKVAVIGSNSFSGSDFIDLLLEDPDFQVLGISRSPEKNDLYLPYLRHTGAKFKFSQLDLNKHSDELMKELDAFKPEYIVNFAAQSEVGPSWSHPADWYQTNALSLVKFADQLNSRDYLKKYVHISSPEVYGTCEGSVLESSPYNPSTPYAASKAAGDMFLKVLAEHRGFPLIMIRATNVYGAYQQFWKIIPRSVIYLKLGKTIELHGGGTAVKSYIHIRDISRGEKTAMLQGEVGTTYHLSPSPDNDGYAVRDIVQRISQFMGKNFDEATRSTEERLGQDAAYIIDSTRARTQLGWKPQVGIDEGLTGVVEWIESNWENVQNQPFEYDHQP